MSSTKSEFERLPRIYEPQVYILELYPNARDFTFCGKVTICMALTQPTNSIVLNAKKIEIVSARVSNSALKSELIAPTKSIVYDEKQEKVTINFDSKLEKGDADLCLEYKGILADDMHGFYRSTYRDSSGEERVILSTQFEPCGGKAFLLRGLDAWTVVLPLELSSSSLPRISQWRYL
ncbi:Puromycin-sensitive aminopeptidase [Echinococcus granulosus]|nr:Puromycin-sensitive aminopeptidase [Echinococcus granulosus]